MTIDHQQLLKGWVCRLADLRESCSSWTALQWDQQHRVNGTSLLGGRHSYWLNGTFSNSRWRRRRRRLEMASVSWWWQPSREATVHTVCSIRWNYRGTEGHSHQTGSAWAAVNKSWAGGWGGWGLGRERPRSIRSHHHGAGGGGGWAERGLAPSGVIIWLSDGRGAGLRRERSWTETGEELDWDGRGAGTETGEELDWDGRGAGLRSVRLLNHTLLCLHWRQLYSLQMRWFIDKQKI